MIVVLRCSRVTRSRQQPSSDWDSVFLEHRSHMMNSHFLLPPNWEIQLLWRRSASASHVTVLHDVQHAPCLLLTRVTSRKDKDLILQQPPPSWPRPPLSGGSVSIQDAFTDHWHAPSSPPSTAGSSGCGRSGSRRRGGRGRPARGRRLWARSGGKEGWSWDDREPCWRCQEGHVRPAASPRHKI